MKLDKTQVDHVAKLANLPLSEEEKQSFLEQLSNILEYVSKLDRLKTAEEPTFNTTDLVNVSQPDEVKECLGQDEALQNTPNKKDNFFAVKGVFSDE